MKYLNWEEIYLRKRRKYHRLMGQTKYDREETIRERVRRRELNLDSDSDSEPSLKNSVLSSDSDSYSSSLDDNGDGWEPMSLYLG